MNKTVATMLGVLLACPSLTVQAEQSASEEEYVGYAHGSAAGCAALMPAAVALALAEWNQKFKEYNVDLAKMADNPVYKKAVSEEAERLKALPAGERVRDCERTFDDWLTRAERVRNEPARNSIPDEPVPEKGR